MELSSKSCFILYNFSGAVIASVIIIGILVLFMGSSIEDLQIIFLSNSSYYFILLPVFVVIFSIVWSHITFDSFIDGKELSNIKCILIGFANGSLSYVCGTGAYHLLPFVFYGWVSIASINIFLWGWISHMLAGMFFFGVVIFSISIGTVFLWRKWGHSEVPSR